MRKISIIYALACIVLLSVSCSRNDVEEHFSNGNIIEQEVNLATFTGINNDSKCDVIIREGQTQEVRIRISDNIINDVDLSVKGGIWTIDYKDDNIATINEHEFTVIIQSPELSSIIMNSSGSIRSDDTLHYTPLSVQHLSSGQTDLTLASTFLKVMMDGSGQLQLSGSCTDLDFKHMSSGTTEAFSLKAATCTLFHDGSGDAKFNITNSLIGLMDGSGDVYYKGNPQIQVTQNGSGQLINAN